jgi:iron complex outermembrane receptor protein
MRRKLNLRRVLGTHPLHLAAMAVLLSLAADVLGAAQTGPQEHIEEPAQPLASALRAIARRHSVSVMFDPALVAGLQSRPVPAQLTALQALTQAVQGHGLAVLVASEGVYLVRPLAAAAERQAVPAAAGASAPGAGEGAMPATAATVEPLVLAQGVVATHSDAGAARRAAVAEPREAQRVEVTGSRLRRIDAESALPVNVYTRADIERSGQPTLERFLSNLPEVSVSPGEGAYASTTGQGTVQLRGLPLGSTLLLVNGRRVQAVGSSTANMFNLSLIPLAAVERVDVLPVGSSAVYGGDALAGVVNIVLKKSIDGQTLDARLGTGRGFGDGSLSLGVGRSGEAGSFLLLGAYSKTTPLTMAERSFFTDADYRRFGGPDTRSRSCTPGTVASNTTANLPGLGASFAAIPQAAGERPLSVADFAATAGQERLCNSNASGRGQSLVHGTEAWALHAVAERHLGPGLGQGLWAFGEFTHTRDRLHAEEAGLSLNNVLVPATNPYNPFGVPVRVTARLGLDNGAQFFSRSTDYTRALGGLRGTLGTRWDYELTYSVSRDSGDRIAGNALANAAARTAALAATNPALALNPFTTGRAASDEVLRGIWSDSVRHNIGRKAQAGAFVRGSALELPAGPVEVIVGAEQARDLYSTAIPGDVAIAAERRSSAVFAELVAPLWRAGSGAKPWTVAALTLAGREDRYSDFGSAGTHQVGLELRPTASLLLRAATATSFKPPTLLQTHVDDAISSTEAAALVDPARGNAPIVGGQVLRTANRELAPEQGQAHTVGAVWEPVAGSRLAVGVWRVRIDGLIAQLLPQVILNNEALFPGFVTRAPSTDGRPGVVTQVRYSFLNFGRLETGGLDLDLSHAVQSALGRWTFGASATRTNRYAVQLTPGAPEQDRLGRRYLDFWAPEWKARVSASLQRPGWSLGLSSRYLGAYSDTGSSARTLGDYWVHDLSAQLDLRRLGLGLGPLRAATVSLSVANLADRQPQFVVAAPYYDVTQADWRGRYASVRLALSW